MLTSVNVLTNNYYFQADTYCSSSSTEQSEVVFIELMFYPYVRT